MYILFSSYLCTLLLSLSRVWWVLPFYMDKILLNGNIHRQWKRTAHALSSKVGKLCLSSMLIIQGLLNMMESNAKQVEAPVVIKDNFIFFVSMSRGPQNLFKTGQIVTSPAHKFLSSHLHFIALSFYISTEIYCFCSEWTQKN